jgi:hypothetical protein
MPNAEIRIQTPYAASSCGSVTRIARKNLGNTTHATLAHFESVFRLFWD